MIEECQGYKFYHQEHLDLIQFQLAQKEQQKGVLPCNIKIPTKINRARTVHQPTLLNNNFMHNSSNIKVKTLPYDSKWTQNILYKQFKLKLKQSRPSSGSFTNFQQKQQFTKQPPSIDNQLNTNNKKYLISQIQIKIQEWNLLQQSIQKNNNKI